LCWRLPKENRIRRLLRLWKFRKLLSANGGDRSRAGGWSRSFSPEPDFQRKLLDMLGLYLNPLDHALVQCVDEKPGIQALDSTSSCWLPLEITTGKVLAHIKQRRTSVNFMPFMGGVVAARRAAPRRAG